MSEEVKKPEEQQEKGKVAKQFNELLAKLDAVLGQPAPKKPSKKVSGSAIAGIVEKLFKAEQDAAVAEVETGLKEVLHSYAEFIKECAAKEKEFEVAKEKKMKEFVEKAQSLFQKIDGLPEIQKVYEQGLRAAADSTK